MEGDKVKTEKADVYIRLDDHVRTQSREVHLKDMASIYCENLDIKARIEEIIVFSFKPKDGKKEVISLLYIYKVLYEYMKEDFQIHSVGAEDCLIELYEDKKQNKMWNGFQVLFVSLITFFGSAFSIMTYDEDAGVADVFQKLYDLFSVETSGNGVLEWSYSVGIALGVIVFFHHFEKKGQRTPTAMEIQMNKYEQDVVETYVNGSKRREKSLEVDS